MVHPLQWPPVYCLTLLVRPMAVSRAYHFSAITKLFEDVFHTASHCNQAADCLRLLLFQIILHEAVGNIVTASCGMACRYMMKPWLMPAWAVSCHFTTVHLSSFQPCPHQLHQPPAFVVGIYIYLLACMGWMIRLLSVVLVDKYQYCNSFFRRYSSYWSFLMADFRTQSP